jgi:8-amino-7-oxononanoate synthase
MSVVDFTSALYLGMRHASESLPGWRQLSLGKPAVLGELAGAVEIERELAALTGCEQAVLAVSTVHLFLDLFTMLAAPRRNIFLDRSAYPVAQWGVERAAAAGVPVHSFPRHDAEALQAAMSGAGKARPVVVTDGFSPEFGTAAPLKSYSECARVGGGLVVVDDTQALGIFGRGGGGSLRRSSRKLPNVVVVSSLAKAFGVPLAMLGGSAALVAAFRRGSATRMHCIPPSAAVLAAARHALQVNRKSGAELRRRLAKRVIRFRKGVKELDLLAVPGLFPVQPLRLPENVSAGRLYRALLKRGIKPVLLEKPDRSTITFVLTARHSLEEIDQAVGALSALVGQGHALPIKAPIP